MVKFGLIGAAVMLVLAIGATLLSPICVPCIALLIGLAAGYLANNAEKPLTNQDAVKKGTLAGLLSGIGAFLGQMIGAVINATLVGPESAEALLQQWGVEMPAGYGGAESAIGYWLGALGSGCCFSIIDVALLAGLGALGGVLWWQMVGKDAITPPPADNFPNTTSF